MTEMVIYGVSFDLVGKQPIVLLKTAEANKFLPIWIGHPEAAAILMKLQGASAPRPLTHDLLVNILGELEVEIVRVTVTELRENTFYASITIQQNGSEVEIDSRSSDAIAVAILDPLLHATREQGLTPKGWEPSHAGAYAANFLIIAGMAPVVEELTFRGLGFSLLVRFGVLPAILGAGLLFALAHGLLQALPELAIFGCALSWLRWRTRSVYPGMLLHATFNGISLVAAVTVR